MHRPTSRRRMLRALTIALTGLAVASFGLASPASAATITVTTEVDEYNTNNAACSLREASVAANTDAAFGGCTAGSGPDTISLSAGVYQLSIEGTDENLSVDGDIDFDDLDEDETSDPGITVQGAGMGATFIDGNGGEVGERVFDVRNGDATFADLTVRNGDGVPFGQRGGGIFFHATESLLTILRSSIHANDAFPRGGGVAVGHGDADIVDSEISDNEVDDDDPFDEVFAHGGGIYVADGDLLLQNSLVSDNFASEDGGGIKSFGTGVTIENSTISGNSVTNDGGGMWYEREAGALSITTSTIDANASSDDDGGGLFIGCCNITVAITRSTVNKNFAEDNGGGIYNVNRFEAAPVRTTVLQEAGVSELENVTVSSNHARDDGGGIWNTGDMYLNHTTVYRNVAEEEGGGVFDSSGLTLQYENSIIARNTHEDCSGTEESLGHNLLGDNSCDDAGEDDISPTNGNVDPRLGPLRDNGGPTKTHELLSGSPAIDNAESGETCPDTDQRGLTRPTGSFCDIGAYEVGSLEEDPGPDPGPEVGGEVVARKALCRRQNPTILGTLGPDRLVGTSGPDVIQGLDANDVILGKGGDDIICGSLGNDIMKGGRGDDFVKGLRGDDTNRGGKGTDRCIRGPGEDKFFSCENVPRSK